MTHLTKLALTQALKGALGGSHFSICGVEKACRILGQPVYENTPDWHTMNALHCASWGAFDFEAKQELAATVARVLGLPEREFHPLLSGQVAL